MGNRQRGKARAPAAWHKPLVTGWKLDRAERGQLLERFIPRYADIVADHVTLSLGAAPLPTETRGKIVGEADDRQGVQALIVSISGRTARPDGSTYHVTWSLDRSKGRRPVESNQLIAQLGWSPLDKPVPLTLLPARF
ncbi:hypothetical protein [Sphingomonas xinjiangensis]|uniref:Uncharacterized protein n=1 Tax=Sphingomonas xinjiangensis TaxID=643568 RepID=A0A840YP67_9SPHN|nr:hypothetical protein [Sphingomonas xinjiangensis]MBB5712326.1 hypothetical protein [Sphingomonas xinjiangensis]